jgi:hypothetical protein
MDQTPQSRALQDLDSRWGHLYDLAYQEGRYIARRIDAIGQALPGLAVDD